MKRITSLLIGCSLTLAGAALAQQPVEQQSPSKNKHAPEKTHATEARPKPNAAKPEGPAAKQHGAVKEHPATNEPGAGKGRKTPANRESATAPETNVSGQREGAATPGAKHQAEQQTKGMKAPPAAAKTSTNPAAPAGA